MSGHNYSPNKHPGACFFCARRVPRGEGSLWKSALTGTWATAHGDCLTEAYAAGKPPEHADLARPARAHLGDAGGTGPAWQLRRARDVIRRVRLDAPSAEIDAAVAELRAIVALPPDETVPF